MLGSAPGTVQAETRDECMANALRVFNDDVMKCASTQGALEDICESDYTNDHEAVSDRYTAHMSICRQLRAIVDGNCEGALAQTRLINSSNYSDCGNVASVTYMISCAFCYFNNQNDNVAIAICLSDALVQLAVDNALCLASWNVNDTLAIMACDICHAMATKGYNDCKAISDNDRANEYASAIVKRDKCLAPADSGYLECVKKAKADRKTKEDACPQNGHGVPPAGHGAPPPPAGHGAP